MLQEGDSGSEVVELQKRLGQLLLYLGSSDGEYDDGVRNAVTSFQNTYGVEGDPKGSTGPIRAVLWSREPTNRKTRRPRRCHWRTGQGLCIVEEQSGSARTP
ncbi:peptidoglycan-binding domain-containing protein [Streptomyces sp. FXJ1.4098]|nr:peptidoglycan-binding domain-containing protein [Streptomyces sp. FXJ1.4098]